MSGPVRVEVLGAVLLGGALLAACSSSEGGSPSAAEDPAPSSTDPAARPSMESPSNEPSQPADLASVDPCSTLTADEAGSLGLPPQGTPDDLAGDPICDWRGDGGGLLVGFNDHLGVDGLNLADASSVSDVTIGTHTGLRAEEADGYCSVYLSIGSDSNAQVQALFLNDLPRACALVDQAAALIEPRLP